jgi:hypothetical protein
MLRLTAEPNRWIRVTAPVRAVLRVNPALLTRWLTRTASPMALAH